MHFVFTLSSAWVALLSCNSSDTQNRLYSHWTHRELYVWLILLRRLLYFVHSCILITTNAATIYLRRICTDSCRIERYIFILLFYCRKFGIRHNTEMWEKEMWEWYVAILFNNTLRFNWNKLLSALRSGITHILHFNILCIQIIILF